MDLFIILCFIIMLLFMACFFIIMRDGMVWCRFSACAVVAKLAAATAMAIVAIAVVFQYLISSLRCALGSEIPVSLMADRR